MTPATPDTPGTPAALEPHQETALPEWVDYNGHMNVAYYVMVFDHGTDKLFDHIGLGKDYREQTGHRRPRAPARRARRGRDEEGRSSRW